MSNNTPNEKDIKEMQLIKKQMIFAIQDFKNRNPNPVFCYLAFDTTIEMKLENMSFYFLHELLTKINLYNANPKPLDEELKRDFEEMQNGMKVKL